MKHEHVDMATLPQTAAVVPDLTVIIPAYNEEAGIVPTVNELRAALAGVPLRSELLVVDDGSTDGTAAAAEALGVRVIRLPNNEGYGAAIKAGIRAVPADLIAIIDADGTYPPAALAKLVHAMADADMAVGARDIQGRNISFFRRPAKWFLNWLAGYLAGRKIPDVNSGLRVMRGSLVRQFLPLLPAGFSFTTTITLSMLCTGRRVHYVPIEYRARVGHSKIRPVHFTAFLVLVLRTVMLFNPLKVFLPLGGLVFLVGMGKLVQDLVLKNLSETAVMAFLSALVIWSLGLLADMVARTQLLRNGSN
ncbi:MAG: glycosyltransferase family 2 protein [Pirellulales bacterium]|nr:glycosyltransferase family 2 protein [Pirellulales bacterium]